MRHLSSSDSEFPDKQTSLSETSSRFDGTGQGFVTLVDRGGIIRFAGRYDGELQPQQLVGASIFDRVPAAARQLLTEKLNLAFERSATEIFRIKAPCDPDGNAFVEIRLVPLPEKDKPVQTVAVALRRVVATKSARAIRGAPTSIQPPSPPPTEELPCERSLKTQHQFESMLRASEERFRQMAECSQQGIVLIDESRIVFANRQAASMAETTVEELLDRPMSELFSKYVRSDSLDMVRSQYADYLQGIGHGKPFEISTRTRLGQDRWIEITAMPVSFDGRNLIQAAFIDITARKEVEGALRDSEERYRTLVENAQNAIFSMEYDGSLGFLNSVAAQMLGGQPADFVGKNILQLFPAEQSKRHLAAVRRVIDNGKGETIENLTELQGKPRWHVTSIHPLNGRNGKTKSAFMISTDITESKLASQRLARERDFTRSILETANSLILCLDWQARIVIFNKECERVTGYKSEEVIGKRWPETFLPKEHRHPGMDDFSGWVSEHPFDRKEEPIITKSGKRRIILWSNSSFIFPDTGELAAIAIGHDITEAKEAQEKVRENEERFKELADLLPQTVFEFDLTGRFTFINRKGLELFGYTAEDLEGGGHVLDALLPEQRQTAWKNILSLGDGKKSTGNEYIALRKDGTQFPVLAYTTQVRRHGVVVGYRGILVDITERKQSEELLRRSQEAFRDLVENVDDVLYTTDRDLVITYVSPVVKNVLGYDPSELVGRPALSLVYSHDLPTIAKAVEDVLSGASYPSEYRMVTKTGEARWVRTLSRSIFEGDVFTGVRGVLADINDRKLVEQALRDSEQRFERVAQQSREMVWEVDADGLYTYVSKAAEKILGYRPDEMVGKLHFYDLQPESERERFRLASFRQIANRESFHNQVNHVETRTGQIVWFLTSGAPILDEQGNLRGYMGADLDITERKRAEEALQEKDEFLSSIIENIPDMIFVKDAEELRFVRFNKAGEELLGYKREELIGKNDYDFFPREQADFFTRKDREVLETGQLHEIPEEPIDTKHGRRIVQTKKIPLVEKNGKSTFLLGISRDVTANKRAQEALRESEERFRELYKGSPIPTYTWQRKGDEFVLIDSNEAGAALTGRSFKSYLGASAKEVFTDQLGFVRDMEDCFDNRATIIREMEFSDQAIGDKFQLILRYTFVPPDLVLVLTEDITKRKQDENALRMSEERFRTLFRSSPLAILLFQHKNDDLELVDGNEAAAVLFKGILPNPLGTSTKHIFGREPKFLNEIHDCFRRRASCRIESPHQFWNGGDHIFLNIYATFIPPDLLLIKAEDVTDRKHMEVELRTANEQLDADRLALVDKNVALREVLSQIKDEVNQVRQNMQSNIDKLIMPILRKLRDRSREGERIDLDLLESLLADVASPFVREIETRFVQLTPRETEICNMIRSGLQSKEMGLSLGISVRTVEKFRQKIRQKLGVEGRDVNLTTYLRSLAQKQ